MTDENEQLDEIMAVRSIYGDNAFSCDPSELPPYSGEILIEVESGKGPYAVKCKSESYTLNHLSPVSLNVTLPLDYPSSNPPSFHLFCYWMTEKQLEMLTTKLIELWDENPYCVILFTWANFLQTEAYEFVDAKFPIDISEDDFRKMTQFSLMKEEKAFSLKVLKCTICKKMKSGCILLEYCEHRFCKECLGKHVSPFIAMQEVDCIICPYFGCTSEVHPEAVKCAASQVGFEKYDRTLLERSLEIMSGIYYCPRRTCGSKVYVENSNDECGVCRACKYVFCVKCKSTCHGVAKCTFQEKMTSAKRRGNEAARRELKLDRSKKKFATINKTYESKSCPKCKTSTDKSENCNKVRCWKCRTYFCWLCSKVLDGANPYKHFENMASHCHNLLYDDE